MNEETSKRITEIRRRVPSDGGLSLNIISKFVRLMTAPAAGLTSDMTVDYMEVVAALEEQGKKNG